ncbi:META domain-containing protein [Pseudonocardia sp. ICBG1142]|uniref:META domain-containing protein n=1 Tax=Pseudonocardia sp. ICBG1142 TaxID=2846760 RepID=UPI0021021F6F|nr:META domain-containing protein [Pseudonocardia sp. ICBG1142]
MHTTSHARRAGAAALLAAATLTTAAAMTTSTAAAADGAGAGAGAGAVERPYYEVWEPGQHRPHHPGGVHVPRPDTTTTDTDGPHAVGPLPATPAVADPAVRAAVTEPIPTVEPTTHPLQQALLGRWTPTNDTTAGRAFVEFTDNGHWTGSDGCNTLHGTWAVHTDGVFTATADPTTLLACENVPIADWLTQTIHARLTHTTDGTDRETLVLHDGYSDLTDPTGDITLTRHHPRAPAKS